VPTTDESTTPWLEERAQLLARIAALEATEQARRQMAAELQASRDQLGIILDSVADGITVQEPGGRIIYANDAAAHVCGYPDAATFQAAPREVVLAQFEILDADRQPLPLDRLPGRLALLGQPTPSATICYRVRATGEEHWVVVKARPVRDDQEQVVLAISILHDITAERRAEERREFLAEATARLTASLDYQTTLQTLTRLAVPRLADGCVVEMLEDDRSLRRVAMHVVPAKLAVAADLRRHYPPRLDAPHGIGRVLRTGQSELVPEITPDVLAAAAYDAEHLRLLQTLDLHSSLTVALIAHGRILGAAQFLRTEAGHPYGPEDLALAEDLTRRAALAADNARLYQTAQAAIAARDEFMSVAAHELRTPITSLRAFAQLLIRRMDKQQALDPAQVRRGMQTMIQQVDKLTRLVSQLLDVSRIEAEKLGLECEVTDFAELVAGVVATLQATAPEHTLVLRASGPLPARLDPVRIEQVVVNLVDNAIKYSPNGGPITITLGPPAAGWVRLAVRDHGLGIPVADRDRLFNRFYQAHSQGHRGGMGLGLYISRQIVQLHQGQLRAEFPPSGGTCFVVDLPTGVEA
jgi:signal transduction histidine kinase/PAS domain-containing protein